MWKNQSKIYTDTPLESARIYIFEESNAQVVKVWVAINYVNVKNDQKVDLLPTFLVV